MTSTKSPEILLHTDPPRMQYARGKMPKDWYRYYSHCKRRWEQGQGPNADLVVRFGSSRRRYFLYRDRSSSVYFWRDEDGNSGRVTREDLVLLARSVRR